MDFGSSMKNRLSSFLAGDAVGTSAGAGFAPVPSATQQGHMFTCLKTSTQIVKFTQPKHNISSSHNQNTCVLH